MINHLIIMVFYIMVGFSLLFGLVTIIRSNVYDLRQSKLKRQQKLHPHARHLRRRPLASVIVYAYNDSSAIAACLDALRAGSYKKIQVIVVDNASSDGCPKVIRRYVKQYPKSEIRLVAKRTRSPRPQAVIQASRYAKGEILAVIDASTIADRQALKQAINLSLQTSYEAILFNTRPDHQYSLLGLADSLKHILASRTKKASGFLTPGLDSRNYAALYNRDFFGRLSATNPQSLNDVNVLRCQDVKIGYASQAVITIGAQPPKTSYITFSASVNFVAKTVQFVRSLLSLLEPLLAGFMIYVAFRFNNPGYIVLAWVSFTGLFMLAVWSDETLNLLGKLRMSFLAVVAYSLYLLRTISNYPALLKSAH